MNRSVRIPALALLASSTIAALVLTSCASPDSTASTTDSPVIIVSGQSAQNGELLQQLFDDYNAANAAAPVTLQMSADTDVDTAQKALVNLASGKGPDAVRVTNATYQTMIDAGAAQPADACLTESGAELDRRVLDGIAVDGTSYQVPWYVTQNALFYNDDLFVKAGLDPDKPPTTMSEFHEAAKAIAATGAAGGTAYFGNDYNFQGYVASLGGRVYDPQTKALGIDSPGGTAAFDLFATMAGDGSSPVYSNFFAEANEAFAAGKLGMIITSASGYPALKASGKVSIRLAPVPTMDGGKQVAVSSTNGFVITTKDPARQRAVCDALQTLLSPEAVTRTVAATATIPLLPSVADDPAYLADVYEKNPDWVAVREQQTTPWVSLPGGAHAEYSKAYVDSQLRVLRRETPAAEAVTSLQAATADLLAAQ